MRFRVIYCIAEQGGDGGTESSCSRKGGSYGARACTSALEPGVMRRLSSGVWHRSESFWEMLRCNDAILVTHTSKTGQDEPEFAFPVVTPLADMAI